MGAENPCRRGQCGQFVERLLHLPGAALEQPTATDAEQRVAAKQAAVAMKSNVRGRVAGHLEHVESEPEPGKVYPLPLADAARLPGNAGVVRAVDFRPTRGDQLRDSAGVVGMVMGEQYVREAQIFALEYAQYRPGVARVDHRAFVPT